MVALVSTRARPVARRFEALGHATLRPALTENWWASWWVSWWGSTHDEIGLVSPTNAIRAAATGGRVLAAPGVVDDIGDAT
jgi:hypothetical protein